MNEEHNMHAKSLAHTKWNCKYHYGKNEVAKEKKKELYSIA